MIAPACEDGAMKLRRVEVFLAVVEAGGFTAAAARLHVAQSAVSVAVRELEEELGTQLFVRGRRGLQLTETGRLLRDRAQPAIRQLRSIHDEIHSLEALQSGHVRLAAPPMITHFAFRHVLPSFLAQYPGVRITLRQVGAVEIEQMVLRGDVDIGVVSHRNAMPQLESILVWNLRNVACLPAQLTPPASGRISWGALLKHPQAVYPPGYHQRALVDGYAARLGVPVNIAIESDNAALLVAAVRSGACAAMLPTAALEGETGVQRLNLPEQEGDRMLVGICWPKTMPPTRAAEALIQHIQASGTKARGKH
jgi:LysR family cyn operon transcriptional activator